MSIYIPNEDKRSMIICPHCKQKQIVNIEPFNKDMTRIAQLTCCDCRKTIYAGIFLLANSHLQSLMQNIQTMIDSANAKNTLLVGDKGPNSIN